MKLLRMFRKPELDPAAEAALESAAKHLLRAQERSPEVSDLSISFRRIRERNHIAEQLSDIFEGRML